MYNTIQAHIIDTYNGTNEVTDAAYIDLLREIRTAYRAGQIDKNEGADLLNLIEALDTAA